MPEAKADLYDHGILTLRSGYKTLIIFAYSNIDDWELGPVTKNLHYFGLDTFEDRLFTDPNYGWQGAPPYFRLIIGTAWSPWYRPNINACVRWIRTYLDLDVWATDNLCKRQITTHKPIFDDLNKVENLFMCVGMPAWIDPCCYVANPHKVTKMSLGTVEVVCL